VSLKFGHEGLGVVRVDFGPSADHSIHQGWQKAASTCRQPATQALPARQSFRRRNGTDRGSFPHTPNSERAVCALLFHHQEFVVEHAAGGFALDWLYLAPEGVLCHSRRPTAERRKTPAKSILGRF
jgi:hypothetical protein